MAAAVALRREAWLPNIWGQLRDYIARYATPTTQQKQRRSSAAAIWDAKPRMARAASSARTQACADSGPVVFSLRAVYLRPVWCLRSADPLVIFEDYRTI